jgi:3-isopropylmalate/(R)-2-methylmalate dehydratase small subunit
MPGFSAEFPLDAFSKNCLLMGVDELGYILQRDALISRYESALC